MLTGHTDKVRALAIRGTTLISGGHDKAVRVWDLGTLGLKISAPPQNIAPTLSMPAKIGCGASGKKDLGGLGQNLSPKPESISSMHETTNPTPERICSIHQEISSVPENISSMTDKICQIQISALPEKASPTSERIVPGGRRGTLTLLGGRGTPTLGGELPPPVSTSSATVGERGTPTLGGEQLPTFHRTASRPLLPIISPLPQVYHPVTLSTKH